MSGFQPSKPVVFSPDAGDAIDEVLYRWERYFAAKTHMDACHALVELNNAMSDLASWHPDYDSDLGEVRREEV